MVIHQLETPCYAELFQVAPNITPLKFSECHFSLEFVTATVGVECDDVFASMDPMYIAMMFINMRLTYFFHSP